MTPERTRHLLVSSLRQRAVLEANTHYGGDLSKGIAGELTDLAAALEAETLPGRSAEEDWLNDT